MISVLKQNYIKLTFGLLGSINKTEDYFSIKEEAHIKFGQINLINTSMEQNIKRQKRQFTTDDQMIASGCCTSFIRSSSSNSIYQTVNSQKSIRTSKDRGIKLTRKNSSHSKSTTQAKIILQSPPNLLNSNLFKLKRSAQLYRPSSNSQLPSPEEKKTIFVQKCLEYKNKRIQQHKKQGNEHVPFGLQISTKQEVCSTMRNTIRTLNSCQGVLLIEKPINYSNSVSFDDPFLKRYKQQKSNIYSQRILLINKKSTSKTLQKIFQETQGKKIVTLESEILNEDQSNQFSVAESYEFSQIHI